MKLQEKVALVTGSAKRIGRAVANALADRGVHQAVHYRTSKTEAEDAVELFRVLGVEAESFQADLSQVKEVEALASEVLKRFGRLDILVNNASVFFPSPLGEVTDLQWDVLINTNLKGPFFLAQKVGLAMKAAVGGTIINIGDWAAERPYTGYLPYCISKAGVVAMTKGLAKALAPEVRVNCINPGPVMLPEDLSEAEKEEVMRKTPLQRTGSPTDIANAVVFLCEGTDFMTGAVITVDGGRSVWG
ncbi:MAG: SDR family oxidoreductase [Nitrospinae bacterium]|jgi:NAD(P)-dependent dehydrogenase (short-subunit alcohol dehydrogenase family)|nr:SDR family oxidoreductase [Nitrospinota bacterium]